MTILKAAMEKKKVTYTGKPFRLSLHCWAETLQAKGEWNQIVKLLKEKLPGKNNIIFKVIFLYMMDK